MYDMNMPTVLSPRDVEEELSDVAGYLNSQHARLVRLTAQAITSGEWFGVGIHTPVQWLTIQVGLSSGRAKQIVAIAKRLDEFPLMMEAFDRGELAVDQVAVAAKAPAWADELVTRFAQCATVNQLRRMIRDEHFDGDPDQPEPEIKPERETCSFGFDDHSRFNFHADLDTDHGMIVDAAMNEARDSLFAAGKADVTWSDTFVEMARRSLSNAPEDRQERFKSYIHIRTDRDLSQLTSGVVLPDAVRDYLTCDGMIQPVWERDNIPFGVGRAQRMVSERTRRIVEHRDRGCRVPGCGAKHVVMHHIIHWTAGGLTETWNLISLCPQHHRLHHKGLLRIDGNADIPGGMTFADARGSRLIEHPNPVSPTGQPPEPASRYEHPTGERLQPRWIDWSHPNARKRRREQADLRPHHDPNQR